MVSLVTDIIIVALVLLPQPSDNNWISANTLLLYNSDMVVLVIATTNHNGILCTIDLV